MVQNPEIAIFMEYVRFLNSHKLALSGLVKGPKPLINSLHAPSSGRFNLRDLSARRGVVLYAYRTHTDSALTSIPSGALSFCQEHSGLPVTRFCLLKSDIAFRVYSIALCVFCCQHEMWNILQGRKKARSVAGLIAKGVLSWVLTLTAVNAVFDHSADNGYFIHSGIQ